MNVMELADKYAEIVAEATTAFHTKGEINVKNSSDAREELAATVCDIEAAERKRVERLIAKALEQHGLTLAITDKGYSVLKLGPVHALTA